MGGFGAGVPCAGAEGQQLESPGSRTGAGRLQADPVAEDQTAQHPAAQARWQILKIKNRSARRALLARPTPNRLSDNPFTEPKSCRLQTLSISRVWKNRLLAICNFCQEKIWQTYHRVLRGRIFLGFGWIPQRQPLKTSVLSVFRSILPLPASPIPRFALSFLSAPRFSASPLHRFCSSRFPASQLSSFLQP